MTPFRLVRLLIALLLPAASPLAAQPSIDWRFTGGPVLPAVSRYTGFAAGPDGAIFGGTLGDGVMRSTDQGGTWTRWGRQIADPVVNAVAVDSLGRIFAGSRLGVDRSTDGGANWSFRTLQGKEVVSLAASEEGDLFAVTEDDLLLRSADGGAAWDTLRKADVGAVVVLPTGTIVMATEKGVMRSTDRGDEWSSPVTGQTSNIVTSIAAGAGRIVAGYYNAGILLSTDDGVTWKNIGLPGKIFLTMTITPEGMILASSTQLSGTLELLARSTDNGKSWSSVPRFWGIGPVRAMASLPGGLLLAGARNDSLYCSTDRAQSWKGCTRGVSPAVKLIPGNGGDLFAVASGRLVVTEDRGEIWRDLRVPGIVEHGIVTPRGTIMSVGSGHFRSVDDGKTWKADTGFRPVAFALGANNTVYAALDTSVYRTTDEGETWIHAVVDSSDKEANRFPSLVSLTVAPNGDLWAGGAKDDVYRSQNGGVSWTRIAIPGMTSAGSFTFGSNVIYVGSADTLYRSTDGGSHWTGLNPEHAPNPNYRVLSAHNALYSVTDMGGVLRSANGGETWRAESNGIEARRTLTLLAVPEGLYLGTDAGVYRADSVTLDAPDLRRETAKRMGLTIIGDSGNPTHVELDLVSGSDLSIMLYNAVGDPVATLFEGRKEGGRSIYRLPVEELPSGVYFCRAVSQPLGSAAATIRLVR